MSLAFLKNITLASNEEVRPAFITAKTSRQTVNRSPSGNKIRLFHTGAVYPSAELVASHSLEYQAKDGVEARFGLDIVSSQVYPNTSHLDDKFIIVAFVPKSEPKVDLFASTKYVSAEDAELIASGKVIGDPKSSVVDQGTTTFGKAVLIPMLEEVYGFKFTEDVKFVDLTIVFDVPLVNPDGNYYIPKTINKGERQGQIEALVRKNIAMFPLVIAEAEEGTETAEAAPVEANVPEINMVTLKEESPAVDLDIENLVGTETVEVETKEGVLTTDIDLGEAGVDGLTLDDMEANDTAEVAPVEVEVEEEEAAESEDDFNDLSI